MYKNIAMVLVLFCGSVFAAEKDHDQPQHGGVILEVGEEVAHLELVHDKKAGKATLYVTGPDAKTAMALSEAPKLNLKTKDGNKQVELKGANAKENSQFEATDEALKSDELKGRIALVVGGKKFNVDLKATHEKK